jgi:hypothetical protein
MAVAELAYRYPGPSMVRGHDGGSEVLLTTSGGVTAAGPAEHPFFFSGFLTDPAAAAQGMLACATIARSRYFTPGSVVAILRDPVVTSSEDRLRFESFSSCCGVHARLDLLPAALTDAPAVSGTTNVDFGGAMRAALGGAVLGGPLMLSVGSAELIVDRADGSVAERKVPLPGRWLKGFGEVQALAARMEPVGELTATAARRFLRSIPRSARRPLWAIPGRGGFSLAASARAGAACIAGPQRMAELGPLLRFARSLRVYGQDIDRDSTEAPSAWELDLGVARFTLTLSPENYRGFSGEGALLTQLADEDAAADALLLGASLGWGPRIDLTRVAAKAGLTAQRASTALGHLAAGGLVGYDLAEHSFFRRDLPFGPALQAAHPRLASARDLAASGAVTIVAGGAVVRSRDAEHRVTFGDTGDRCTCPWWGKHRGSRGPCKHVLAARVVAR